MSLSSRLSRGQDAAGPVVGPRPGSPRTYSCHYCAFQDSDPEVVFDHMNRRECRRTPREEFPEWRRRARENRLPAKELS